MKVQSITRSGDLVRIIDQTALPERLVYKELDDYREIILAIKRLEIRGAPAIGIAAAYAIPIALAALPDISPQAVRQIGDEIKAARPTAVNLSWAVDRMLAVLTDTPGIDQKKRLELLWREAESIHEEDREMCARIGRNGADLIADNTTLLTHCNTGVLATGGIGTALAVVYTCQRQGKRLKIFANETRPLLQGARLTVWELMQEGIDVTLICDSVAGMLMQQGSIDYILVGADRIAANGDMANKIGTYSLAVLAKEHGIPFYVAAPQSTFDLDLSDGGSIIIEERAANEVTDGFGRRIAPEGVKVYSPAFDMTPASLISTFITDSGLRPGGRTA